MCTNRVWYRYARGWLSVDLLTSVPFDLICSSPPLALLKIGRLSRWRNMRNFDRLAGTSWVRIVQVELIFLLVAHYMVSSPWPCAWLAACRVLRVPRASCRVRRP